MEEKSNTQSHSVRGIEIFGHAIGGVGQNMVYALWSGFITAFYTDIFGMNPAVMATIFVVARVWDAFNDPMMGILADRTRSKYGRYRCWLLRMPIVVATCLVLNFTVPNFGNVGNIVYAVVTYILMGMAFTSVDIPYWSMPAAMTSDPNERTKIFTTANLGTNIASTVGNMLIPILLVSFGGTNSAHAYFMTAVIFAVIGAALYLTCFALTREHVQPSTQKFSFRLAMKSLAVNKPLFCIMITNLVINLAFIMKMTLNYYYTTYTCKVDVSYESGHIAKYYNWYLYSAFISKKVRKEENRSSIDGCELDCQRNLLCRRIFKGSIGVSHGSASDSMCWSRICNVKFHDCGHNRIRRVENWAA